MKLPKYKDLLKMSKEKLNESLAPIRAIQARRQGELEMAKLDEKIITLETEINELCTKNPIPFTEIINKQNDMALTERKKKQFQVIIDQLFSDE